MTSDDSTDAGNIDLDSWTPAGKRTVDYAIDLLSSIHQPEIRSAETWLLAHPDEATPALIAALRTPAAQPAAILLGAIGHPASVDPLVAAYRRGGEVLRLAVERGLALHPAPEAAVALAALRESS